MTALCAGWTNYGAKCQLSGKLNEDGAYWCGIHAPSAVKARRIRSRSARRSRRDQRRLSGARTDD